MRPRVALTAAMAAVAAGALFMVPAAGAHSPAGSVAGAELVAERGGVSPGDGADPSSLPAPPPVPALRPGTVRLEADHFWSWALIDRDSGAVTGSQNLAATSTTASMIKPWLAADHLRRSSESGRHPGRERLAAIRVMIRDSENEPATVLYDELGGAESIERLIARCDLTDSAPSWRWSLTELSARDAARMADCLADGRAAGPEWTGWLLAEMRQVRGISDFGIREAFAPSVAAQIAVKNGYFARPEDGMWHLNCLAVTDGWALAVIQRYPEELGRDYGAANCRRVAAQLRTHEWDHGRAGAPR